ncbi:MAG: 2Fe-2S iron-sulfur cluster-binding protein, partial [Luminiphilus sp.]|nr:2Fe-2S iron-sulfur cluster-binding protein [Luminiphilus sp.]
MRQIHVTTITINGEKQSFNNIDPAMPLLWALRDHAGIQGVKYGCGVGQCGACTVWLDGFAVRSCQLPV